MPAEQRTEMQPVLAWWQDWLRDREAAGERPLFVLVGFCAVWGLWVSRRVAPDPAELGEVLLKGQQHPPWLLKTNYLLGSPQREPLWALHALQAMTVEKGGFWGRQGGPVGALFGPIEGSHVEGTEAEGFRDSLSLWHQWHLRRGIGEAHKTLQVLCWHQGCWRLWVSQGVNLGLVEVLPLLMGQDPRHFRGTSCLPGPVLGGLDIRVRQDLLDAEVLLAEVLPIRGQAPPLLACFVPEPTLPCEEELCEHSGELVLASDEARYSCSCGYAETTAPSPFLNRHGQLMVARSRHRAAVPPQQAQKRQQPHQPQSTQENCGPCSRCGAGPAVHTEGSAPDLTALRLQSKIERAIRVHRHELRPVPCAAGCSLCGVLDCPDGDAEHYGATGCPTCTGRRAEAVEQGRRQLINFIQSLNPDKPVPGSDLWVSLFCKGSSRIEARNERGEFQCSQCGYVERLALPYMTPEGEHVLIGEHPALESADSDSPSASGLQRRVSCPTPR
ncbi:MAG: hypothetical protein U1A78_33560 [Polyangia bacterium]